MQYFLFLGSEPRFYSLWEGQTFTAEPGEVREFDVPPTDGLWVLAPKRAKKVDPVPAASEEAK